jgi:peptide deformylase
VLVNPVLRPVGEQAASFFEGCLSVRGYAAVVTRAHEVEVTGLDETGAPVRWQVSGWPARILQHELDHLDGTLYVDRMHTRTLSTPEQVKARFAGRPMADVLRELGVPRP